MSNPDFERMVIGNPIPCEQVALTSGARHVFSGQCTVLVFYPGDFTPVCTKQWCSYQTEFNSTNDHFTMLGVTQGEPKRHTQFKEAYGLPFEFVTDEADALIDSFRMKNRFGFVKRAIALIDSDGILRYCKSRTLGFIYPKLDEIRELIEKHC